jgi:hypothetical protein
MKRSSLPRHARVGNSLVHRAIEALEVRRLFAAIVVTTTSDALAPSDGTVSLREAITEVDAGVSNTIDFAIPQPSPLPATGPAIQTIIVGGTGNGALPALTKPVTINGYTESGASANTLAVGDNAKILIQLNGANAGPNADGILLAAGAGGSTVEGLDVNRFSANGIEARSNSNVIKGNFAGINPQGNAAYANQVDGIRILSASYNTIGGTSPAARNVSSGNLIDGIHVDGTVSAPATYNLVEGNYTGTNAAGTGFVGVKPNEAQGTVGGNSFFGIELTGANHNTVGGVSVGARNVVGFNVAGIEVDDGGQDNVIEGNYSGVGADGVTPVGNNLHGIVLRSNGPVGTLAAPLGPGQTDEPSVSGNIIGLNPVTFTGLGNLVEFNGTGGVAIFSNPLPNNPHPVENSGNSILGNSIFENGRSNPTFLLGILLTNELTFPKDGPFTPNDSSGHGAAAAPDNWQDGPVLSSATLVSGGIKITGTMTQKVSPDVKYRIEFYSNNPDPLKGNPEGQTLIGTITLTTNAAGTASFSQTFNANVNTSQVITADATNLTADPSVLAGSDALYDTSEFSVGTPVTSGTSKPAGTTFELINPATQAVLGQITSGEVISLSALHVTSVDIADITSPAALSTTFSLNGTYEGLSNAHVQTLLSAEHSTKGLGVGTYSLTVQTFSETYGRGIASAFTQVGFQIVA